MTAFMSYGVAGEIRITKTGIRKGVAAKIKIDIGYAFCDEGLRRLGSTKTSTEKKL
jgi:hypothetical protein